jgi:UPF0176 protein
MFVVAALYHFTCLADFKSKQVPLKAFCKQRGIKGTLLLANEGINGTVAGTREAINELLDYLRLDPSLAGLEYKESLANEMPFYRMKVKLKREIVTMGIEGVDPNQVVGTYVDAQDWNALITDPDVLLVDTRNDYEYEVGTFKQAINPKTETFREFPEYIKQNLSPSKHKKIATFCTGGIRCEKATAYMKEQGFDEVYHLKGGILKYLEEVPAEESLWEGECFVFDNRVTVKHGLEEGSYDLCHGCRHPINDADKADPKYTPGVTCPKCFDHLPEKTRLRAEERQKQIALAKASGKQHIGSL